MKEKNQVVPDEVLSKEFISQFKTEADVSKFLKYLHVQVLEIVNENWPELLSIYKMEGVKPETSFDEKEITLLRKSGINTFHELSARNSYLPMGGGITSAGTSMMAMQTYVEMLRMLNDIETNIRANVKYFVSHVEPKGHPFRNRFKFVFVCRRYRDEIRFYDVVNNNFWAQTWKVKTLRELYGI